MDSSEYLKQLQNWYRHVVRRYLEKQGLKKRVVELDADCDFLERQSRKVANAIPVCFLGSSGVGKSTLINAIVAGSGIVVPSGGIGPLTARELKIDFSEEPMLSVGYHKPKQIWKLLFALQQNVSRGVES